MATSKIPMNPLINKINFHHIGYGSISRTNNPLAIAEELIKKTGIEIWYVSLSDNTGYTEYAPADYSVYTIFHMYDTVTIYVINFMSGIIYTNARSRNGNWCGWKKVTMQS